jgi:chromosome segregation ATPase
MNLQKDDRDLLPMLDNNVLQLIEVKNQVIKNLEQQYKDAHHQRGQAEGKMQNLQINFNRLTDQNAYNLQDLTNTKKKLLEETEKVKKLEEEIKALKKLDAAIIYEHNKILADTNAKIIQECAETKKRHEETVKKLEEEIKALKKLDAAIIYEHNKILADTNAKIIQECAETKKRHEETRKELQKMIDRKETKTRNKKIKKYIREHGDDEGYISFDGDDNCDDCPGWDGFSHRCECGNRRMDWYDEDGEFYPEPY